MIGLRHVGRHAGWMAILLVLTSCSSSIYGWQARTNSTPTDSSFTPMMLTQEPSAVFLAMAPASIKGNEVPLGHHLYRVLKKVVPNVKVVSPHVVATRVNREGLVSTYAQLLSVYEETNILDRDLLRKIATAVGARYVFQPRLAYFSQRMTERWSFFDVRIMETRSSVMRLTLQLWDSTNGELVWGSATEVTMQNEAVSEDPVYFEDEAVVAFGSMVSDLFNRKTSSRYTPVDKLLDDLIGEDLPEEFTDTAPREPTGKY